jgi:four helix bundle protein
MGSADELEYLFLLARDLSFLGKEECNPLMNEITEIKRMLASFIRKLNSDR